MARTLIPVETIPENGGSLEIAGVAADATNDHEFVNDGLTLLHIDNQQGAATVQVTVVAVADEFGRAVNEVITVTADKRAILGPFIPANWNQAGAKILVDLDVDTTVTVAAIRFSLRK